LERQFIDLSPQKRARAVGRWQLRIESLPVASHKVSDAPFNIGHPRTAMPAGREMSMNLI
jgi:hypothetical protein